MAYGQQYGGGGRAMLEYVDVMPECLSEGGIFSDAEYERFDGLVRRANNWLRSNPGSRIVTCESIELKQRYNDSSGFSAGKMTFFERGEAVNRFIRGLRLWVRPCRPDEPPEPQQIGYMNVVPARTESGAFSSYKFEDLGVTLQKLNGLLRSQPLSGRFLNVETQDMKCHTSIGTADPDECHWRERGKTGCHFVMVLRIFFELGPPCYEELGSADFVPRKYSDSGWRSEFEPFGHTLAQAREWLRQQVGVRFLSVQSIDYKLKRDWDGERLDSHRTSYYERGEGYTRYVRIIRVSYARPFAQMAEPALAPLPTLNYKTFVPVLLSDGGLGSPTYESMGETWHRAKAWLNAAGVTNFLSVETVWIRLYSGRQHGDHEVTYTRNHGDRNETWLAILRLFIDGPYNEPPPEALPSIPEPEADCCVIL